MESRMFKWKTYTLIICTVSVSEDKFKLFQLFLEELLRKCPYLSHQLENMDSEWGTVWWVKGLRVDTIKLLYLNIIPIWGNV